MKNVFIFNGRFLSSPATGVQRVAQELICAVDAHLAGIDVGAGEGSGHELNTELYAPMVIDHSLKLKAMLWKQGGKRKGVPWEQLDLLAQARRGILVNLCNTGPVMTHNAVTMFHDAQVYITPRSYSRAFRLYYKWLQPLLARRHRLILTVSEFSKQQLVAYGVAPASKIAVIHNGVDHILKYTADRTLVDQNGLSPRGYVIAQASTQAHKNLIVLLKAFAQPELKGLKLVLFGSPTRDAVSRLNGGPLPDNVLCVGKTTDDQLRGLIENALCLACPSRTEGFGLPPLEAMLIGCPTVVAPCGALPEVCADAALYADPDEPSEWAAQIAIYRDTHDMRQTYSDRGVAQAKRFSWAAAAQKLVAQLTSLH